MLFIVVYWIVRQKISSGNSVNWLEKIVENYLKVVEEFVYVVWWIRNLRRKGVIVVQVKRVV